MTADRRLRLVAAGAGAAGVLALGTGWGWAAALAGLCAVATAVLALRTVTRTDDSGGRTVDESPPVPRGDALPIDEETAADEIHAVAISARSSSLLREEYLDETLRSRVAIARRALRPLSVVHVEIVVGAEAIDIDVVASAARATLRESDLVARRQDGVFVLILEDTAEDGAVWTTERLRRHLVGSARPERVHAGVASYPNHGLEAETISDKAEAALSAARAWGRDRIEVAANL